MSSQDLLNVIGVTATVSLGILSIGLGAFAIWLSKRFEERSSAALEAIRDLARETRALVDVAVGQQREFSTKMLDSILSRDPYGTGQSPTGGGQTPLEELVRKQLAETEQRIGQAIEQAVRKLPGQSDPKRLEEALAAVREGISHIVDAAASRVASPITLPKEVAEAFKEWQIMPAHFVLLLAIIRERCRSSEDVKKVSERYGVPSPFDQGLRNLIDRGVLVGNEESFDVAPELRELLPAWLEANRPILDDLVAHYLRKGSESQPVGEVERALGLRIQV